MEVIKCGLCKEEIEYAQHCRVYIRTDESRPFQRVSKRPHIGRYKLISTAKSTEHISFARRLKRLRETRKLESSSSNSSVSEVDLKARPSLHKRDTPEECKNSKFQKKTSGSVSSEEEFLQGESSQETLGKKETDKVVKSNCKLLKGLTTKKLSGIKESKTSGRNYCVKKVVSTNRKSFQGRKAQTSEKVIEQCEQLEGFITEEDSVNKTPRNYFVKKVVDPNRRKSHESTGQTLCNQQTTKNMSYPQFQSSFEEYIKPKCDTVFKEMKPLAKDTSLNSPDSEHLNRAQTSSTSKLVKNGPITTDSNNSECETYYWLETQKPKPPESRKLGYQFDNLVSEVKHMKLPNLDWKIKIMVHKQEMVSVSFTKKLVPEKVVTVNAKSLVCDITIDGKKVVLLGSPVYIHSIKDLEIMLDIVNDVETNSPMLSYVNTKPVS